MAMTLAEPWLAMWRFSAAMAWGGVSAFARMCDTRPLRTFWTATATQTVERYLRSPEFLQFMAGNLKTMASLARLNSPLRLK
jgi:hypothetical protein